MTDLPGISAFVEDKDESIIAIPALLADST
jgi:hypothetical protein